MHISGTEPLSGQKCSFKSWKVMSQNAKRSIVSIDTNYWQISMQNQDRLKTIYNHFDRIVKEQEQKEEI